VIQPKVQRRYINEKWDVVNAKVGYILTDKCSRPIAKSLANGAMPTIGEGREGLNIDSSHIGDIVSSALQRS